MDWIRRRVTFDSNPTSDIQKQLDECRKSLNEAKQRILDLTVETQVQNAIINDDNNVLRAFATIMEEDIPPPPPEPEFTTIQPQIMVPLVEGGDLSRQLGAITLKKKTSPVKPQTVDPKMNFFRSLAQEAKERKALKDQDINLPTINPRFSPKTVDLEKKKEEAEKRSLELKAKKYGVTTEQLQKLMNEAITKRIPLDKLVDETNMEAIKREMTLAQWMDEKYKPIIQPNKKLKKSSPGQTIRKSKSPPGQEQMVQEEPKFTIGVPTTKESISKPKRRGSKSGRRGSQKKTMMISEKPELDLIQQKFKSTKSSSSRSPSPKSRSPSPSSSRSPSPKSRSSSPKQKPQGSRSQSPPRKNPQSLLEAIRKGANLRRVSPSKRKETSNIFDQALEKMSTMKYSGSPLTSSDDSEWMSSSK